MFELSLCTNMPNSVCLHHKVHLVFNMICIVIQYLNQCVSSPHNCFWKHKENDDTRWWCRTTSMGRHRNVSGYYSWLQMVKAMENARNEAAKQHRVKNWDWPHCWQAIAKTCLWVKVENKSVPFLCDIHIHNGREWKKAPGCVIMCAGHAVWLWYRADISVITRRDDSDRQQTVLDTVMGFCLSADICITSWIFPCGNVWGNQCCTCTFWRYYYLSYC